MLGRTHLAVGVAAALALFPPDNIPALVVGTAAGALGGLLPDIDIGTSDSHKKADIVVAVTVVIAAVVIILEWIFHIGIKNYLMNNESIVQVLGPTVIFIAVGAFGKGTKHRTFMHSIVGLIIFTACIGIAMPTAAPYFAVGFISHIFIDLLNKKKVQLIYPMKKGFCFSVCSSKGLANRVLFISASGIAAACIIIALWRIAVQAAQNYKIGF